MIEKEKFFGLHSSGRNSGVIHAGIYYKPDSLKAKVCISGAKRLKNWCKKEGLSILNCGKVIIPQCIELKDQIKILFDRGKLNGAEVYIIDDKELKRLVPYANNLSGEALWSPNTCVIQPMEVLNRLIKRIKENDVKVITNARDIKINVLSKELTINKQNNTININYAYLFNTTGLYADNIAKKFDLANDLRILPFKGIYWKLSPKAPFKFSTNLYPVPDLNVPFLGVHFTPSIDGSVNLGPTAVPAFGRENYKLLEGIEPCLAIKILADLIDQWSNNNDGFRKYAKEQSILGLKPFFLNSAKKLVPSLQSEHLIRSDKVGIRPQLFDVKSRKLIQDFKLIHGFGSTHVLNAISPAFTASFELADLIIDQTPSIFN